MHFLNHNGVFLLFKVISVLSNIQLNNLIILKYFLSVEDQNIEVELDFIIEELTNQGDVQILYKQKLRYYVIRL
jgi:hypothetical protein